MSAVLSLVSSGVFGFCPFPRPAGVMVARCWLLGAKTPWKRVRLTRGTLHNEVIMYSLTTCGFCKAKARELRSERIAFKEYYIDKDKQRQDELNDKLQKAGV